MLNKIKKINQSFNRKKISQFLFYLFVFLLPWQTIFLLREVFVNNEKFQYVTIGVYAFEIVLILWIVAELLIRIKKEHLKKFIYKKINLTNLVILFLFWSFLSITWSGDKFLTLSFSLQLLLGVSLFFLIQRFDFDTKKTTGVFLLSMFFQCLLGIVQFFTQSSFSNKWIGLSNHPAYQGGVSVLENITGRWLRGYGAMPHPNILGGFLSVSLILGLLYYIKISNKNNILKNITLTCLSLESLALLITFSRTALIGFFIGLLFIYYCLRVNKKFISITKISSFFVVFLAISLIFLSSYSELVLPRFLSNSRLESKSVNERIELKKEAEKVISKNFLLGVGAGNYTNHTHKNDKKRLIWKNQPVHNTFLLILSELGVVGISIFIGIAVFAFKDIRNNLRNKKIEKIFFLSALMVIFIACLFDHWVWTSASGLFLSWMLLGLYRKF